MQGDVEEANAESSPVDDSAGLASAKLPSKTQYAPEAKGKDHLNNLFRTMIVVFVQRLNQILAVFRWKHRQLVSSLRRQQEHVVVKVDKETLFRGSLELKKVAMDAQNERDRRIQEVQQCPRQHRNVDMRPLEWVEEGEECLCTRREAKIMRRYEENLSFQQHGREDFHDLVRI